MALTNAERQARDRTASEGLARSRLRYRRPVDRRSRPQRWHNALQTLLALQEPGTGRGRTRCRHPLAGSTTAALLEQVCDLDLSELEALELPKGFGRDG